MKKRTVDTPLYEKLTTTVIDDRKKLSNTTLLTSITVGCMVIAVAACIVVLF